MNSQLLYLEDPFHLEFEAVIRHKVNLPDGRIGVILERTYFYPTGGGQEHDTGTLGEAQVVDVFKDETEDAVIHIVDQDVPIGIVFAIIDKDRRLRHMQHHTAQHLLTQCFIRLFDLETVSANINGYTPSTLDLPHADLNKSDLDQAEELANQIIYEDRQVKTYLLAPDQLHTINLRKPPSVSEDIRIVEIEAYDYSACGGTHCTRTGMVGVIKILKTERMKGKTRIHFVAGRQALDFFRTYQNIVVDLAEQMSIHPQELVTAVQRQVEQLKSTQKELQALRLEGIGMEARELAAHGEALGPYRLVLAAFDHRPVAELRALANEFKKMAGIITILGAHDGRKVSLVAVCSQDTGLHAGELLNRLLSLLGGKGGGDQLIAQGGGPATAMQFQAFFADTRAIVMEMLG